MFIPDSIPSAFLPSGGRGEDLRHLDQTQLNGKITQSQSLWTAWRVAKTKIEEAVIPTGGFSRIRC